MFYSSTSVKMRFGAKIYGDGWQTWLIRPMRADIDASSRRKSWGGWCRLIAKQDAIGGIGQYVHLTSFLLRFLATENFSPF